MLLTSISSCDASYIRSGAEGPQTTGPVDRTDKGSWACTQKLCPGGGGRDGCLKFFSRGGAVTCYLSDLPMRATAALGKRVSLALASTEIQSSGVGCPDPGGRTSMPPSPGSRRSSRCPLGLPILWPVGVHRRLASSEHLLSRALR